MEKEKDLRFNETQLIMLASMWRKFDFQEFIEENDWIDKEGSVSWFDEQFTDLGFKMVDYGDQYKKERKDLAVSK